MHPVIEHLLARQGATVPINDGRKIALVLYGGNMHGIRGMGALVGLQELGLAHAFNSIYTYSAGLCNASYFLAEQTRLAASVYYDDLSGHRFINLLKIWKLVDIDYLIKVLSHKKQLLVEKMLATQTKLWVRLFNTDVNKTEYLEAHTIKTGNYFELLRAATSMRFLTSGSVRLGRSSYKDWAHSRDLPEHLAYVAQTDATDILVIPNSTADEQRARQWHNTTRIFVIKPPVDLLGSSFNTNTNQLRECAQIMGDLVKRTFGIYEPVILVK